MECISTIKRLLIGETNGRCDFYPINDLKHWFKGIVTMELQKILKVDLEKTLKNWISCESCLLLYVVYNCFHVSLELLLESTCLVLLWVFLIFSLETTMINFSSIILDYKQNLCSINYIVNWRPLSFLLSSFSF